MVILFPHLTSFAVPVFRFFYKYPLLLNIIRTLGAFILMLVPTTAMGATLGLLIKTLYKKNDSFGSILGLLYGYNTLGAVLGCNYC